MRFSFLYELFGFETVCFDFLDGSEQSVTVCRGRKQVKRLFHAVVLFQRYEYGPRIVFCGDDIFFEVDIYIFDEGFEMVSGMRIVDGLYSTPPS